MPELFLKRGSTTGRGGIASEHKIQSKTNRIIYKLCEAHGNIYAVMKKILDRMYGLKLGGVRAPLPNLVAEDESVVAQAQEMIENAIADCC